MPSLALRAWHFEPSSPAERQGLNRSGEAHWPSTLPVEAGLHHDALTPANPARDADDVEEAPEGQPQGGRQEAEGAARNHRTPRAPLNSFLAIRIELVSTRPAVQDQACFIRSSSAKAPNRGGRPGTLDPTRTGVLPIFAAISGGSAGSAIRFALAPQTHSAPSSPRGK